MIIRAVPLALLVLLTACSNMPMLGEDEDQAAADTSEPTGSELPNTLVAATPAGVETAGAVTAPTGPNDGQTQRRVRIPPEILQKIGFDLTQFDDEGLLNTNEGKRSIIYEYCIPRAQQAVSMLSTIDFSIEVKTDTSGSKVSCNSDEALALGSSHQDSFKAIVVKIASLPFVRKIEQSRLE